MYFVVNTPVAMQFLSCLKERIRCFRDRESGHLLIDTHLQSEFLKSIFFTLSTKKDISTR